LGQLPPGKRPYGVKFATKNSSTGDVAAGLPNLVQPIIQIQEMVFME